MSEFSGSTAELAEEKPKVLGQSNQHATTHQAARPLPYMAGTCKFSFTWISDLYDIRSEPVFTKVGKGSKERTGTVFTVGFAGVGCHGPLDVVREIRFDGLVVWEGTATRGPSDDYVDITIEGRGSVRFYWGTETQTPDAVLEAGTGVDHPAYRGQFYGVFDVSLNTNATQLPNIEVIASRYPTADWMTADEEIDEDANLAACIGEWCQNRRFGLGLPDSLVDTDSLALIAETLVEEGFGLSPFIDTSESFKQLLMEALEYVDGYFYGTNQGKIAFTLNRTSTSSEDSIPSITQDDLTAKNRDASLDYRDTSNTIFVGYSNREKDYEDDEVTFIDRGNLKIVGEHLTKNLKRSWVTKTLIANRIASRHGRIFAIPYRKGEFPIKLSSLGTLKEGDRFYFTYPQQGIDFLLCRITRYSQSNPSKPEASIEWVEDLSELTDTFYQPTPTAPATPEELTAAAPQYQMMMSCPRGVIAPPKDYGDTINSLLFCARATVETGYEVYFEESGGGYSLVRAPNDFGTFSMRGHLLADYTEATDIIDEYVKIQIVIDSTDNEIGEYDLNDALEGNLLAFVNDEILALYEATLIAAATYECKVIRERFDTVRASHSMNDEVWVAVQDHLGVYDPRRPRSRNYKFRPYIVEQKVDLDDVTPIAYVETLRRYAPGRPLNLAANGDTSTPTFSTGEDVEISWDVGSTSWMERDSFEDSGESFSYVRLEFYDSGDVLQGELTVDGSSPYTLANASIVSIMGSEQTFKVRAYSQKSGYESFAFSEVTVNFV